MLKNQVWAKGKIIRGHDSSVWRKDQCDAWIKYSEYGNRKSQFGWEIDHISPGGKTILSNLRPLQWRNNVAKSNGWLKRATTAKPFKGTHLNI
ncbi:MAG: HNH endonuclease [Crocinitomicaceae bacterium]|nr:hypothetical protein [Flavobacteriales bacterium]NQZ35621.1 HNH endonuclease [Crocinitomicaceae bacterium]